MSVCYIFEKPATHLLTALLLACSVQSLLSQAVLPVLQVPPVCEDHSEEKTSGKPTLCSDVMYLTVARKTRKNRGLQGHLGQGPSPVSGATPSSMSRAHFSQLLEVLEGSLDLLGPTLAPPGLMQLQDQGQPGRTGREHLSCKLSGIFQLCPRCREGTRSREEGRLPRLPQPGWNQADLTVTGAVLVRSLSHQFQESALHCLAA